MRPAPGGGVLRPRVAPKMMYPLVLDLAAIGIAVTVTCRVLGFSTQAFYAWKRNPIRQRDWDDAHLINAAIDVHEGDPEFGTGSSPTSWPPSTAASAPGRTGCTGCAASSGSSRCSPRSAAPDAGPASPAWSGATSPLRHRTSSG